MLAILYFLLILVIVLLGIVLWQRRRFASRPGAEGGSDMNAEQERFRVLFEQSSDAHLLVAAGGVLDCNAATVNMLGARDKRELIGVHPARFSPEFQADGRLSSEKAKEMERLAREKGHHRFDWLHRRLNGSPFLCEVTITPVKIGGNTVLLVIFHDLTERIAIDERVRLLSSVVAESDSMIVIIDAGQRILYGNPAFERSSGYSLAEVEERNAGSTLIAAPDTPAESLQRICEAIKGQKAATAEIVSRRKNGIAYWVEVHVAPVLDTRGLCTHFVAIGYDITERKRAAGVKEAQTKLLALGADVGRAITTGVSLADMLDRCAAALMRHLDAAFVRIWTTSPRRTC